MCCVESRAEYSKSRLVVMFNLFCSSLFCKSSPLSLDDFFSCFNHPSKTNLMFASNLSRVILMFKWGLGCLKIVLFCSVSSSQNMVDFGVVTFPFFFFPEWITCYSFGMSNKFLYCCA